MADVFKKPKPPGPSDVVVQYHVGRRHDEQTNEPARARTGEECRWLEYQQREIAHADRPVRAPA